MICVVMACKVMAYIVMAYIVMAYIVMAYLVISPEKILIKMRAKTPGNGIAGRCGEF